ncbi:Type II secretion system protein [Vibrio scophthalmi]|uniref:Type II secretion system protein n=1 Tax=Vibrio scophthalmi TaxID=45658 RepID=A0A1C7FCL6_9VIBR|nr:Type II secretion system protein [Vibrio scophthalmi]
MAAFEYKALNAKGKSQKGVMEGDNARQVRSRLKEQGLVPIDVVATRATQQANTPETEALTFKRGISTPDLALITRQLSTLVQSGMPLEECLRAVSEQAEKTAYSYHVNGGTS